MASNILKLNEKLNQCKSEVLSNYQNPINLYDKTLSKYNLTASTRECSQLVAYNYDSVIIRWEIVISDSIVIYSSDKFKQDNQWTLDLSILNLPSGTPFKFRANLATSSTEYSVDTFIYVPLSNTLYYYYKEDGGHPITLYRPFNRLGSDTYLHYLATITSPTTPPILKCSAVSCYNDAMLLTKFQLRIATTGDPIYISGRYRVKHTWSKKLSELNIGSGTRLILHSAVIAGEDSEGYVVLEYDPTSTVTANFTLGGVTANNITIYGKPHYVHS